MAQWSEHRSKESEGLRVDSSWGLTLFSLSHAQDKTKKYLSLLLLPVVKKIQAHTELTSQLGSSHYVGL